MLPRARKTGLACAACALVLPAVASANATVSLSGGQLAVLVQDGTVRDHGIIAEPFSPDPEPGRGGFRVRQDRNGRPPFSGCTTNFVFNDVVCLGARRSIVVNSGPGADTVVVSGTPGGREGGLPKNGVFIIGNHVRSFPILNLDQGLPGFPGLVFCLDGLGPVLGATIDLGSGSDFLLARDPQPICAAGSHIANEFLPDLDADGGGGQDAMAGASQDDRLGGGPGEDTLFGGGGNDALLGGTGDDSLNGGLGDDRLDGGSDGDFLQGAEGEDTVDYRTRTVGIRATQDAQANDGEIGEGDNVDSSVEIVMGGSGNDVMVFVGGDRTLLGNDGPDQLTGGSGDDRLEGGAGSDGLRGGLGVDVLLGGSENDVIDARDGVRDGFIRCGAGNDTAFLDLQDGLLSGHSCEFREVAPADDGHPSHGVAPVRVAGKSASVRVLCPRAARIACRGALTVRTATGRRVLGRGRYDIAVGRTVTVQVRLASRPGAKVVVETKEQGLSKKGPRSSNRLLRVASG